MRWSSPSLLVRFGAASLVYDARLWRTNGFQSAIPCKGPHPRARLSRSFETGCFLGALGAFRAARRLRRVLDRADDLGEERDGVSLLFSFLQRAGGVSA